MDIGICIAEFFLVSLSGIMVITLGDWLIFHFGKKRTAFPSSKCQLEVLVSTPRLPITSMWDFVARMWVLNLIPNSLSLFYPLFFLCLIFLTSLIFNLFFISLYATLIIVNRRGERGQREK